MVVVAAAAVVVVVVGGAIKYCQHKCNCPMGGWAIKHLTIQKCTKIFTIITIFITMTMTMMLTNSIVYIFARNNKNYQIDHAHFEKGL